MRSKKHYRSSSRRGILTFEWILILLLLVIGIVSGVAAVRDMTILKFSDTAKAMAQLDTSYTVAGFTGARNPEITGTGMVFDNELPEVTASVDETQVVTVTPKAATVFTGGTAPETVTSTIFSGTAAAPLQASTFTN